MSVRQTCSIWFATYIVAGVFIGRIVYHRYPGVGESVIVGMVGGGIALIGLVHLAGVWTRIAEAMRLRTSMDAPPYEDETIAAAGTLQPLASALASALPSPFTGRPCVIYKYEVRNGDALLYAGFALAPSAIELRQGQVRILEFPDLQMKPSVMRRAEAVPNFSEYIARTEFREASAPKETAGDDGGVRSDTRLMAGDVPLDHATFKEWSLAPGDRVFASGRYSAQRGGLVHEPNIPRSLILLDSRGGLTRGSLTGALSNLGGAALFLGIVAAGLLGVYAFISLDVAEQMSPRLMPTWREVRLERFFDRNLRSRMRNAGPGDSDLAAVDPGGARGRVAAADGDHAVSRATASQLGDVTVIRIDDDAVILTIDGRDRPLRLRFGNEDADAGTFARDLDLKISESSRSHVAGRLTYFHDGAVSPACRVTFDAVSGSDSE